MLSSTVYKAGPLVDKNAHFIGTKMLIFNNFGSSSQHLKFDAGQNSTVGCLKYNSSLSYSVTDISM